MNDLYTIIEELTLFVTADVVYKIILPLVLIALVFDIVRYLFARDSKKEDIIDAFKAKAVGLVALIFLPVILLWFISFLGKISNSQIQTDTSVLEKLINRTTISMGIGNSSDSSTTS